MMNSFKYLKYIFIFFFYFSIFITGQSSKFKDFNFNNWFSGSKNFVEVSYGSGNYKYKLEKKFKFNKPAKKEVKIGRSFQKPVAAYQLIDFSDNYFFASYSNDFENKTNRISTENWSFGLGYRKGYANNFNNFLFMPYYQIGLVWNNITTKLNSDFSLLADLETFKYPRVQTLEIYRDKIKFGTQNIGGINLLISSNINIGVSYETEIIFPYHKFWKHAGSFFIETLAQTGIDFFIRGVIIENAPAAAPLLNFILKNGLNYYFFTLKQDKMNWPFDATSPLTMEIFSFNFMISI